jgi:hypothetical protein
MSWPIAQVETVWQWSCNGLLIFQDLAHFGALSKYQHCGTSSPRMDLQWVCIVFELAQQWHGYDF